mgnify:CR=1 FL=1
MKRRMFAAALGAGLAAPTQAIAQTKGVARIGWLSFARADSYLGAYDAFRLGLSELGYAEGRNVTIEAHWGDDSRERMNAQAAELARARPDVVVAQGPAVFALKSAGSTLPTVFAFSGDPVEAGLVDSLARPGRNMTGLTQLSVELVGKRMEMLKQALPQLRRVAVIANTAHAGEQVELRASRSAAEAMGLTLEYLPIRGPAELASALDAALRARCEAIVVFPDAGMMRYSERVAAFANEHRMPAISGWSEFARRGNLLSYGPNASAVFKRLAYFVDRLLKGARPQDLPVELPTVVEFVINLSAARRLGVSIPQSLLLRADEVMP